MARHKRSGICDEQKMPWVLIDVSWLAHRARMTLHGLTFDDFPTGVIYGFFEQIRTIAFDPLIESNKMALFFDSRQSYRKRQYPDYKRKRQENKTPEEMNQLAVMYKQIRELWKTILPSIGFRIYRQTGLESDDLMAQAAAALTSIWDSERKAVIITADGDLYQCISNTVYWYNPGRNVYDHSYLDPLEFFKKKGVEPHQWAEVKAIAGCSSDNVKGIPGVGEISARAFLLGMMNFNPKSKKYKAITSPEGRRIIRRNRELVCLPHKKTRPFTLREPSYNPDAFFTCCERFGMVTYLKGSKHRDWLSFFKGEMDRDRQITRKRGERRAK